MLCEFLHLRILSRTEKGTKQGHQPNLAVMGLSSALNVFIFSQIFSLKHCKSNSGPIFHYQIIIGIFIIFTKLTKDKQLRSPSSITISIYPAYSRGVNFPRSLIQLPENFKFCQNQKFQLNINFSYFTSHQKCSTTQSSLVLITRPPLQSRKYFFDKC